MAKLIDFLPNADAIIALGPEDLGMVLLRVLQSSNDKQLHWGKVEEAIPVDTPSFPVEKREHVRLCIWEAWNWLILEGLLMRVLDQTEGWYRLTRKAGQVRTDQDIEAYKHGTLLPEQLLHPQIAAKVRPMFLRGDYDVAVVQAFKEVEVAVRTLGKLPDELVGVNLMRTAFHPQTGPLTDTERIIPAEREAIMHLFSGAFGHARNPLTHRDMQLNRIAAAELIVLASYLLSFTRAAAYIKGLLERI